MHLPQPPHSSPTSLHPLLPANVAPSHSSHIGWVSEIHTGASKSGRKATFVLPGREGKFIVVYIEVYQ